MTYVMSDIHGCYGKYRKMLEIINFGEEDTLYILGDLTDRGEENMKVVLDIMERKNVKVILGNHDDMAAEFFSTHPEKPSEEEIFPKYSRSAWFHNGRDKTFDEFYSLPADTRRKIVDFWSDLPVKEKITVGGKKYHLSHSIPDRYSMTFSTDIGKDDYLWGEPEFFSRYHTGMTMIIGHTPTTHINPSGEPAIFKGESVIDIDCGAVFGGRLACLRLDDMEEFYVD